MHEKEIIFGKHKKTCYAHKNVASCKTHSKFEKIVVFFSDSSVFHVITHEKLMLQSTINNLIDIIVQETIATEQAIFFAYFQAGKVVFGGVRRFLELYFFA